MLLDDFSDDVNSVAFVCVAMVTVIVFVAAVDVAPGAEVVTLSVVI